MASFNMGSAVINTGKLALAFLLLSLTAIWAQNAESIFHVKYVTDESIYLDAGSSDSLAVGDTLNVKYNNKTIAEIEIVYAAEHSSSCKIISSSNEIKAGTLVEVTSKAIHTQPQIPKPAIDTSQAVKTEPPPVSPAVNRVKAKLARVDGVVALQFYRFIDKSPAHLSFAQPSLRFNLKASRLFGQDMTLTIRSDSRYDSRSRVYSPAVPKTEWRNRIYQFSLSYAGANSPYNFEIGRIISNKFCGVGYIDGFMAQRRIRNLEFGGYGGTQPQWQYSSFQSSLRKYGFFASYAAGDNANRFESSVAATGEYHNKIVSREFFFIRNSLNIGGAWNFYQSAEIDMNRAWRKQRTGQSLALTNLYLSARGKLSQRLSVAISYDNRKNYWTFETRSIADRLFDSVLRRGARADLTIQAAKGGSISSNFGYHKRTTDIHATYSYGAGLNKNNFLLEKQYLNLQLSGFSGPLTDGHNLSLTLGRYLWAGNMLSVGYSAYSYKIKPGGISRLNQSIQASGQFDITRTIYLSGNAGLDFGKDTRGRRITGEMGYRF